ncbi:MAG TPA: DNA-processing protein DprA [Candidatus Saccharimonadales bacterium]
MKINSTAPDKHKFSQILINIDPKVEKFYYIGALPEKRMPTVAIVGTRKPTAYGKETAYRLSNELAAQGIIIISGLALGIDGIAHQAALDAGGTTLAVMGGGLNQIYPRRHQQLAEHIVKQGGALISEYPNSMPPLMHQFLERNRIISGLSDVVIIIEAAARSGTLATARWGLEQGKTIMAVPGNITSPLSAGCNQLIKAGAHTITSAKDVLDALNLSAGHAQQPLLFASSPEEQVILDALQAGERDGELLHQKSGLDAATFQQTLTMLEITGKIRPLGANQWTVG